MFSSFNKAAAAAAGIALGFGLASSASAAVMYSFIDTNTPTNSRDASVVNSGAVGVHDAITFEFVVADALAANTTFALKNADVLSWSAFAGTDLSTISSDDARANIDLLHVTTNALGDITTYNILVHATNDGFTGADPINPTFTLLNIGSLTYSVRFIENNHGQNTGGAVCTLGCQHTVTMSTVREAVAGVPEPASWALMLLGFGGVGAMLRRGRQSAFTAA
jgi:hypothetical protein